MTNETDLRAAVSRGRIRNIYLLAGNDPYLIKRYTEQIANKCVLENKDLNLFNFNESVSVQQIYDAIFQFSFTGEHICVTVSNYNFEAAAAAEFKKLLSLCEQAPENNTLVLYYDVLEINTKRSDRFKKLAAAVEKGGGMACEINHKTESELVKMLCSAASKRGAKLEAAEAKYMISVCSNDLNLLVNELEKLTSYSSGSEKITRPIIDAVCSKTLEANVFDLSRHILNGRSRQALELLNALLSSGTKPAEIFALICSAYVDIYRVKAAEGVGLRAGDIAKDFGYAPNRAFVLNNASRDGKNLTESQLSKIINELLEYDSKIKNQSGLNLSVVALECLIVNIIKISGER